MQIRTRPPRRTTAARLADSDSGCDSRQYTNKSSKKVKYIVSREESEGEHTRPVCLWPRNFLPCIALKRFGFGQEWPPRHRDLDRMNITTPPQAQIENP